MLSKTAGENVEMRLRKWFTSAEQMTSFKNVLAVQGESGTAGWR